MYWELWLSQVTASAALQCMLVQNKGGQALCIDVARLDYIELNCLAWEEDIECGFEQNSEKLSACTACVPHDVD